jgi:hypothetical protein
MVEAEEEVLILMGQGMEEMVELLFMQEVVVGVQQEMIQEHKGLVEYQPLLVQVEEVVMVTQWELPQAQLQVEVEEENKVLLIQVLVVVLEEKY